MVKYFLRMHQNININNVRAIDAKLYNEHYYDYMLYKGEVTKQSLDYINGLGIVDLSTLHIVSGILYSTITWSGATNNGVDMNDIGLTGMDNGLISFDKTRISNEQFLELYLNSKYHIESGDTRLFMTPVTGNTGMFEYPMYAIADENDVIQYIACKGGFYQGFFKLEGFDYQVVPDKIEREWVMHFEVRPRSDYEVGERTINFIHPENKGIFFFMGTRAENKYWPYYKVNSDIVKSFEKPSFLNDGYLGEDMEKCTEKDNCLNDDIWLKDEPIEEKKDNDDNECIDPCESGDGYFSVGDKYFMFGVSDCFREGYPISSADTPSGDTIIIDTETAKYHISSSYLNTYDYHPENLICGCCSDDVPPTPSGKPCHCGECCKDYFIDDYFDSQCPIDDGKKSIEDDAIRKDISLASGYTDSEGHDPSERGYYEITSDNKFLMFDRTPSGFTADNWVEDTKVTLYGRKNWPNANYFMLMNRTPTGWTVHNIQDYNEENSYDYNIYKDIRNNVFALRIREDGAVGYRYGVLDCSEDNMNRYSVIEEYSKPGMVKTDEWNSINVRFCVINPALHKCDNRPRKMRIMIYVNGFLKFISKELDTFSFKALDELYQKQEAVPYNMSLGGGSMGLLETILPDYYKIPEYILPIERDFCGSFLGDIKSFKMYVGFLDYSSIKNYLSIK